MYTTANQYEVRECYVTVLFITMTQLHQLRLQDYEFFTRSSAVLFRLFLQRIFCSQIRLWMKQREIIFRKLNSIKTFRLIYWFWRLKYFCAIVCKFRSMRQIGKSKKLDKLCSVALLFLSITQLVAMQSWFSVAFSQAELKTLWKKLSKIRKLAVNGWCNCAIIITQNSLQNCACLTLLLK